jgi:hypothetical protein
MREILSGDSINPRKKDASDTPLNGMNHAKLARNKLINATRSRHDRIQEREETPPEKYQSTKLVSTDDGWHRLPSPFAKTPTPCDRLVNYKAGV